MQLSSKDLNILTRVSSFPFMDKELLHKILSRTSNDARAVGRILISGERDTDKPEWKRMARKFSSQKLVGPHATKH